MQHQLYEEKKIGKTQKSPSGIAQQNARNATRIATKRKTAYGCSAYQSDVRSTFIFMLKKDFRKSILCLL
jgi:hypothetical protein